MNAASVQELVTVACHSLTTPRHTLTEAPLVVPDRPGLYAIYAAADAWTQLGLDPPGDGPLYVGKAERSLVTRDLNTHFRVGRTGQSTVRRTFAALLRHELGLRGVPRNEKAPERPANFALSAKHDASLNSWMNDHLRIATWVKPPECAELGAVEGGVIVRWVPPLNLRDNKSAWKKMLSAARAEMANDVRAWAAKRGLSLKPRSPS